MSAETWCRICGKEEFDHHEYEALDVPNGCVCDPRDWGNPYEIPKVCKSLAEDPKEDLRCMTCEHDKACHGESR